MKLFLESQDTDIWDIVENGPFTPTIAGPVPNSRIPKPKADWTTEEKHKVLQNSKAKYYLTCALGRAEYDKIVGKETAKEIWDTLQTAHDGTD